MRCYRHAVKLNPGIVRTVQLLNARGFDTCDSGDGETRDHVCDRDVGYVVVKLRDDQPLEDSARAIFELLRAHGYPVDGDEPQTAIQANFSPVDGHRFVDIHNIHDRMTKLSS